VPNLRLTVRVVPAKKRFLIGSLAAAVVSSAVVGLAATMGLTQGALGANNAGVSACDGDGVTTSYATTWDVSTGSFRITSVTVKGVADLCDGLTAKVALTNGSGADIGSGTLAIPTDAAVNHPVSVSPNPAAADVASVHAVIG
jgi:hypothetical protein